MFDKKEIFLTFPIFHFKTTTIQEYNKDMPMEATGLY